MIFKVVLLLFAVCLPCLAYGQAAEAVADGKEHLSEMDLLDNKRPLEKGDRIVYRVLEEREPPINLFVEDDGKVDFPLVGRIDAAGKTPYALASALKEELEKDYFYRATVLIDHNRVDQARGRVTVLGEVRSQGAVPLPYGQNLTASEVVMRMGGLLPSAQGSEVALVRRGEENGEETRTTIDMESMLRTGNFTGDPVLQPGDLILVPKREEVGGQIYVHGQVNRPGLMPLPDTGELTVSEAILQAGGFTKFARQTKVRIVRGDTELPEDERTIYVNVEDVLEKGRHEEDVVLRDKDVVFVDDRIVIFD